MKMRSKLIYENLTKNRFTFSDNTNEMYYIIFFEKFN